MKASLVVATLVGAALFVSSESARADGHASGLGAKGSLILSADRLVPLFGYTHASVTTTSGQNPPVDLETSHNGSSISLLFGRHVGESVLVDVHAIPRVAFDLGVIDHLTVGAGIAFAFGLGGTDKRETQQGATVTSQKSDAPTATAIGLAPRVGYVIPFGEKIAFWPRLGFGFYSVSVSSEDTNNQGVTSKTKTTDTYFSLDLDPQFAIIPIEHFFFTVGPILNIGLTGSRSTSFTSGATTMERSDDASLLHFGIAASLGGYLDLF